MCDEFQLMVYMEWSLDMLKNEVKSDVLSSIIKSSIASYQKG